MADVKISALPAASAGATADLVPIVQSGTTKYVTIANMLKVAPAIGGTTPAAGAFTTLSATGAISGATGAFGNSVLGGFNVLSEATDYQLGVQTDNTHRMYMAISGTTGRIGTLDNFSWDLLVNNAAVGTVSATGLAIAGTTSSTSFFETTEIVAPIAGAANTARIFAVDSGAGKTILKVQFASGSAQTLATEP